MARAAVLTAGGANRIRLGGMLVGVMLVGLAGCFPGGGDRPTIWVVAEQDEVFGETAPAFENEVYSASEGEVRLVAALQEDIGFQLVLGGAGGPTGPFALRFAPFVGPSGALAAEDLIRLYRAQYVRVERFESWYPAHTGRSAVPLMVPDALVPWESPRGGGPLASDGVRNAVVWVDVDLPATITPGRYRSELRVVRARGGEDTVFRCGLRLDVLPVALPSAPTLPVFCRVDPCDLLRCQLGWDCGSAEQTRILPGIASHQRAWRLVNGVMETLHAHRATPILWASFPKYQPADGRRVEIDWEEYDRLVGPWMDGTGYADRIPSLGWPIPFSVDYPNAGANGGLTSAAYARLAGGYLAACRAHFAERGWLDQAFLRPLPPAGLSASLVSRAERIARVLRQSEVAIPAVMHLPARSMRGLGWHGAPAQPDYLVDVLAPPATWFEPEAFGSVQDLGRQGWFVPTHPPYSGSLGVGSLAADPRSLAWQAYRYGADAIWIEHAVDTGGVRGVASERDVLAPLGLVYRGDLFGLPDGVVPSMRLKRLRRGIHDHALLELLGRSGRQLLSETLAEQVVRWGFTDACVDNLLSCRDAGWVTESATLTTARGLMLAELASAFAPEAGDRYAYLPGPAQWGVIMNQASRARAGVRGVRLQANAGGWTARLTCDMLNKSSRTLSGAWQLLAPPVGWSQPADAALTVPAGTYRQRQISFDIDSLAYNTAGAYPFVMRFDTREMGAFDAWARLAVAACPALAQPPQVDGSLADWPLAANSAAGDFRLCRGIGDSGTSAAPILPTQAFFGFHDDKLYVGVRCALQGADPPLWRADNTVTMDGAIPWQQDVVEILLDPKPAGTATVEDLFVLQIKPSGMLLASRGPRTAPPIAATQPWSSGARVAVERARDYWSVEIELPMASLGEAARENALWGLNVTRLDARRGEYSSWSGARGHCYDPQRLGNLVLLRP